MTSQTVFILSVQTPNLDEIIIETGDKVLAPRSIITKDMDAVLVIDKIRKCIEGLEKTPSFDANSPVYIIFNSYPSGYGAVNMIKAYFKDYSPTTRCHLWILLDIEDAKPKYLSDLFEIEGMDMGKRRDWLNRQMLQNPQLPPQ